MAILGVLYCFSHVRIRANCCYVCRIHYHPCVFSLVCFFLLLIISGPLDTALIYEANHHPHRYTPFSFRMESHEMSL